MLLSGLSFVPQPSRLIEGPALVLFVAKENSFASSCFSDIIYTLPRLPPTHLGSESNSRKAA